MRKQYHFRKVNDDIYIWDVHQLIKLSQNFETKQVKLYQIKELDEAYWFDEVHPTTRQIIEHIKLIQDTDLSYPIILSADGRVMDGMHRVAKAVLLSLEHIGAVQFKETPPPDFINVDENELDYD
nr:hypothetical protein [Acinetobacter sp. Marseille-Q1620]